MSYDISYYQKIRDEEAPQAERLAAYLWSVYKPRSVIDFGCADGLYLVPFVQRDIDVLGVDYSPALREIAQIDNLVLADLRKPYFAGRKFDLVLCLEMLEHIEAMYAEQVVENIARAGDLLVVSAAAEGQGGEGHVNCRPERYWVDLFAKQGFVPAVRDTIYLIDYMKQGYRLGWLTQNVIIYRKMGI